MIDRPRLSNPLRLTDIFFLILKQVKIIQQDKNQQDKKMYCLYYQKRKKLLTKNLNLNVKRRVL